MSSAPIHDSVFQFRAVRSPDRAIEDDPEPMVQQQFARLRFFHRVVGTGGGRVLDWGCGSGFNGHWLKEACAVREVFGFDLSADAVELARRSYPEVPFAVADACDPALALRPGHWDRILSCEVLEHVPDMDAFLANIRRHLAADGVAFVSTPNRLVFSLGFEPSPVNKEHIKELDLPELAQLLRRHFSSVTLYGQRFRNPALLKAWEDDVRGKIALYRTGARWVRPLSLRERLRGRPFVNRLYQAPALRSAWKMIRWRLGGRFADLFRRRRPPYRWDDFEFASSDLTDSVWFCAVLRP